MALFDRNDNDRGYYRGDTHRGHEGGGFMDRAQSAARQGWDRVENTFDSHDEHARRDYGNRGYNAGGMDRDGGLNQRNSWADRGWTADAAERTDREWNLGNRGRMDYDRDMNATRAGWHAGGMNQQDRARQWNLGGMDRDLGHNWGGDANRYDRGYAAGGMRSGPAHGTYDRGYMAGGMNRYGADYDRGGMGLNRGGVGYDRGDVGYNRGATEYDHGYKTRQQTDLGDPFGDRQSHTPIRVTNGPMGARGNFNRYDETYRGDAYRTDNRNDRGWF